MTWSGLRAIVRCIGRSQQIVWARPHRTACSRNVGRKCVRLGSQRSGIAYGIRVRTQIRRRAQVCQVVNACYHSPVRNATHRMKLTVLHASSKHFAISNSSLNTSDFLVVKISETSRSCVWYGLIFQKKLLIFKSKFKIKFMSNFITEYLHLDAFDQIYSYWGEI